MEPDDEIRRWREGSPPKQWEELTCHQRILADATGESRNTGQILTAGGSMASSAAHFSLKVPKKGACPLPRERLLAELLAPFWGLDMSVSLPELSNFIWLQNEN